MGCEEGQSIDDGQLLQVVDIEDEELGLTRLL